MRKKRSVIAMLLCAVMVASVMAGKLPGHSAKAAWDGSTITVKVVDDKGNPVQGVMLFMKSEYGQADSDLKEFAAVTDAKGITTYNCSTIVTDQIMPGDSYYLQPVAASNYTCDNPIEVVFDEDWDTNDITVSYVGI